HPARSEFCPVAAQRPIGACLPARSAFRRLVQAGRLARAEPAADCDGRLERALIAGGMGEAGAKTTLFRARVRKRWPGRCRVGLRPYSSEPVESPIGNGVQWRHGSPSGFLTVCLGVGIAKKLAKTCSWRSRPHAGGEIDCRESLQIRWKD